MLRPSLLIYTSFLAKSYFIIYLFRRSLKQYHAKLLKTTNAPFTRKSLFVCLFVTYSIVARCLKACNLFEVMCYQMQKGFLKSPSYF
uniref:Uncharacterized protein n=1 Tax=Pararge aegeria TaxID=116150 RepID=S4P5H8_9NEOP